MLTSAEVEPGLWEVTASYSVAERYAVEVREGRPDAGTARWVGCWVKTDFDTVRLAKIRGEQYEAGGDTVTSLRCSATVGRVR